MDVPCWMTLASSHCFAWSSGGADYAHASAQEFGIVECFVAFLPKPDVVIDDQPMAERRTTRHVYPLQASEV